MFKMLSLKSFRQLLDQTTNFGELIPHLQEILSGDINIEFGNSLLHTLSLFSENELTFEEWEELYNTLKSKLKVSEFTETTYYSIIRLFSSHFGFQLVETKGGFTSVITDLLQELEKSPFHFRRRTFFPIIQRCYLSQNKNLALHSYLNCQVRKIPLEPVDMACLLGTLDWEFQHTLWLDIVNNQTQFDSKSLGIMNKVFRHSREVDISQIIDIIPPFSLSKLEQTQVLNTLRTHVDSITRTRRALLKTYDKFISELKKMKYSVVIDGANVGRFNQGVKSQGELNFNQIHLMVKIIKSKGHQVLLCLNQNHLRNVNSRYDSNGWTIVPERKKSSSSIKVFNSSLKTVSHPGQKYISSCAKTFLLKWGISIKFFKNHYLRSDQTFKQSLNEPKKNLNYYTGLLKCKIAYFYHSIFSKKTQ